MADISSFWSTQTGSADWSFVTGDIASGNDLETSVINSLFIDARLPADQQPTDGTNNRHGHWSDSYEPTPAGSLLWTFRRKKKTDDVSLLVAATKTCEDALAWMITGGIASVQVGAAWLDPQTIGLQVNIGKPSQSTLTTFRFSWAWDGIAPGISTFVPLIYQDPTNVLLNTGDIWGALSWGAGVWA
jgi:phage gp46-like protein